MAVRERQCGCGGSSQLFWVWIKKKMYQAFRNPKQNSLRKWEGKGCGCLKSQLAGHTHRDTASDLPLPSPLLLLPGCFSHVWLCATPCTAAHQALLSMGILQARILAWVAMSSSRGVVSTQGSNLGLLHCRQILYHCATREALFLPYQTQIRWVMWFPCSNDPKCPQNLMKQDFWLLMEMGWDKICCRELCKSSSHIIVKFQWFCLRLNL